MNSQAQQNYIKKNPILRFSEFKGEWEKKRLGEVTKIYDGTHQTPDYVKVGIPFYSVEHVTANNFEETNYISIDVFEKENKRVKLERDDILMTRIGDIGTSRLIDWDVKASFYVSLALIKRSDIFHSKYLNQYIKTETFQRELWNRTIHVAFPKKINLGEIGNSNVMFPVLLEQIKISSFLSEVDQWIENLREQKEYLEKYKKGMMQKIFSQEIRFRDANGKDFPDWEEKMLGDVLDIIIDNRGKTPPIDKSGIPLLEVNSLGKRQVDYSKVNKYVSEDTYRDWFRKYLKPNDILFSTVGATALCSLYSGEKKAVVAQNIVGLRFKEDNPNFVFYLITEKGNNHKFKRIEMGAVQPSVKVSQMTKIKFLFPFLPEQNKIADFLSSIDDLVDAKQRQISLAEEWKKGLMQQMFI